MKKIYKNWTIHNLIAHPVGEIIYLSTRVSKKLIGRGKRLYEFQNWLHDVTIPVHQKGTGRG